MDVIPFHEYLRAGKPILLDGATGTEIYRRGVFINRSFEDVNLKDPQLVISLHEEYKHAGAMVLSTNTWAANRLKLRNFNLEKQLIEINQKGVEWAKSVAKTDLYVMGCVGPLGVPIEPLGPTSYEEARALFGEQIKVLAESGVDFIALETFDDLSQLKEAVIASRSVAPHLPVLAYVTMTHEGTLPFGTPVAWALKELQTWDVDMIGLNCSVGPQPMLGVIEKLGQTLTKPIAIKPNAGFPKVVEGRQIYMATPEYMAHFAQGFLQSGVQLIGGCCGTNPQHIRAMASSLRQARASLRKNESLDPPLSSLSVSSTPSPSPSSSETSIPSVPFAEKSVWSKGLAEGRKVYTVELLPPTGTDVSMIIEQAKTLKAFGLDAINLPDGPRASARMSAMMTALVLEREAKIETVLHYTCRDRNLLSMQSDMLGAQAMGLRNMLLVTGDPPKLGHYPNATGVFDVDAIGLTQMVAKLNRGFDLGDRPIKPPCSLSIGVGVNPVHRDFFYEMGRFVWKVKAGAEWAITQPVFDERSFMQFFEYCHKEHLNIPIIAGVWPLVSYRNALFLHNEVPGVVIPEKTLEKLSKTQDTEEAKKIGIDIARDLMHKIFPYVQGFQIAAPFGKIDIAMKVMEDFQAKGI